MRRIGIKFLVIIATIYALVDVFDIGYIEETSSLVLFAFLLLIINVSLKPLLLLVSLPVTLITFGLFSFVVNAWMIMLADRLVKGVEIYGFWNSLLLAIIFSILNSMFINKKKNHS